MKSALFICSANKLRSPTAETVFSSWTNIEVESAGLNHDADVPLSPEQLEWADVSTIAIAAFVLTSLATLYPARRAALVNPAVALRYE